MLEGCFSGAIQPELAAGATVSLVIDQAGNTIGSGTLRMPAPPGVGVTSHRPEVPCSADSCPGLPNTVEIILAVQRPLEIGRIEIRIEPTAIYAGGRVQPGETCNLGIRPWIGEGTLATDTATLTTTAVECSTGVAWDSIRAVISATGFDMHYTVYARDQQKGPVRRSYNIESPGATPVIGIIAAAAINRTELLFIRVPD